VTEPAVAPAPPDFSALWTRALTWDGFLEPGMKYYELWDGVYRHVEIPPWAKQAASRIPGLRLLVLAEDWCGDAANTVPVLQRLTEEAPGSELRILRRDAYPEVMDRYLTNGGRAIPIAILLDADFRELRHWGPRPAVLQAWMIDHKQMMPSAQRYAYARRWYAQDKGESTLREVLTGA